jgi:hypothetical protein
VSGFINANTTWNVAGSPYIVNGNALLSHGYTLTIDPGVVVKFDTNRTLQIDGELIAIGTAANRITFTSLQPSPHPGDWGKIHFSGICMNAVYDTTGNYISGCIMKYCDVLYGGSLDYGEIHVESSSPYISHCNVKYSSAAGIYCAGSTYLLDSSLVSDNSAFGLYFNDFSHFSCGLLINGDTIKNNAHGGLYLGTSNQICITEVRNSYFISNSDSGAIYDNYTQNNVTIRNNYFLSNSSTNRAIVHFFANVTYFQKINIIENYFYNNHGDYGMITFVDESSYINILRNYFGNNISTYVGIVYCAEGLSHDTISCNTFLNNQIANATIALRWDLPLNNGIITNNLFDGNTSVASGYSVLRVGQGNGLLDFSNNIVRNNSAINGTGCYIKAYLNDSTELLRISHNEFQNNTADNIIYLDGTQTNNSNFDFLYMKHNNFLDATNHIELSNHIPYGAPNIYADSNYWGSTSTQHIDSIIYDYFDYGNLSVVYYLPILTQAEEMDTTCSNGILTTVAELKQDASLPFPNPFSSYTEITVGKELNDASLLLYNVFGQKVREMDAINGKHISLLRENLPSGIYIYEITEKEMRIGNGKLVVE